MEKYPQRGSALFLIVIGILALGVGFLFASWINSTKLNKKNTDPRHLKKTEKPLSPEKKSDLVNKHLKVDLERQAFQKRAHEIDVRHSHRNRRINPDAVARPLTGSSSAESSLETSTSIQHSVQDTTEPLEYESSIESEILSETKEQKLIYEYNQRIEKEYIEAFLQNARNEGYEVILNDNLEVIKVKKIPKQK